MNDNEKATVESALVSSCKIYTAARARILDVSGCADSPHRWKRLSGLQGGLALVRDNADSEIYLRLVETASAGGVIWERRLTAAFDMMSIPTRIDESSHLIGCFEEGVRLRVSIRQIVFIHPFHQDCLFVICCADERESKKLLYRFEARKFGQSGLCFFSLIKLFRRNLHGSWCRCHHNEANT